jgi:hypothetical protein
MQSKSGSGNREINGIRRAEVKQDYISNSEKKNTLRETNANNQR